MEGEVTGRADDELLRLCAAAEEIVELRLVDDAGESMVG